jgi:hypothetical protein
MPIGFQLLGPGGVHSPSVPFRDILTEGDNSMRTGCPSWKPCGVPEDVRMNAVPDENVCFDVSAIPAFQDVKDGFFETFV